MIKHPSNQFPPQTIESVYGRPFNKSMIPPGFRYAGFGIPQVGDHFVSVWGAFRSPAVATEVLSAGYNQPRILIWPAVAWVGEVYKKGIPPIPEGYRSLGYRKPKPGDLYLGINDLGVFRAHEWENWDDGRYRIILEKVKPPKPEDVYGYRQITTPLGYNILGFRKPNPGELFLSNGMFTVTSAGQGLPDTNIGQGYRYVVEKLPAPKPEKTIRVVRVLEYVGPERWINQTLQRNAVKQDGLMMNGGSYATPNRDFRIRELSMFQEEVK